MTWVIALPGYPIGAVVLADVRVSLTNEKTKKTVAEVDGLQKIYPVAQNIVVGFSGSVPLGLGFVDDLRVYLTGATPGRIYSPSRVAWKVQRRLRYLWRHRADRFKHARLDLLLVGAWPAAARGFTNSDGFRFRSPDFAMERLPRGRVASIGSGNDVAEHVAFVESLRFDWDDLGQFMQFPYGPVAPLVAILAERLSAVPSPGVSSQFVAAIVRHDGSPILISESPRPEIATPPLVTTVDGVVRLCRQRGIRLREPVGLAAALVPSPAAAGS